MNTSPLNSLGHSTTFTFKPEWITHLSENLPVYGRLPSSLQTALHHKIGQFIQTTNFETRDSLELCDEMIISIAAQACMLVVQHEGLPYEALNTVIIYPSAFESLMEFENEAGELCEKTVHCEGESWEDGTVHLAWDAVCHGASNMVDGDNVTMHEFAHQLDALDGDTDGVPLLATEEAYNTWANALGEHCGDFIEQVMRGEATVIDPYGATNPGEFFAVVTETFFEKPRALKAKRPSLYAELQSFYGLDPADWF
ncbi:MAG: zinc-dependent peptidase [Opitutaceae bacterium]